MSVRASYPDLADFSERPSRTEGRLQCLVAADEVKILHRPPARDITDLRRNFDVPSVELREVIALDVYARLKRGDVRGRAVITPAA